MVAQGMSGAVSPSPAIAGDPDIGSHQLQWPPGSWDRAGVPREACLVQDSVDHRVVLTLNQILTVNRQHLPRLPRTSGFSQYPALSWGRDTPRNLSKFSSVRRPVGSKSPFLSLILTNATLPLHDGPRHTEGGDMAFPPTRGYWVAGCPVGRTKVRTGKILSSEGHRQVSGHSSLRCGSHLRATDKTGNTVVQELWPPGMAAAWPLMGKAACVGARPPGRLPASL